MSSSEQFSPSAFLQQNYSYSDSSSPSPHHAFSQQQGSSGNTFYNQTRSPSSNGFQQHRLWMGDLDQWWDENSIKQIWASVGESTNLVQIKVIYNRNVPQNPNGGSANLGYCFLSFSSQQAAQQALSHNGTAIPGTNKFFKLNWASAGQLQQSQLPPQQLQQQSQQQSQEFSIFVGDLAPDVAEKSLFELFQSQYPSCSSCKIMIDPITGNSRGYGFVKFTDEMEQNKALLEMQSAILNGRPIRVSTATKNPANQNSRGLGGAGVNSSKMHQQAPLQQQQSLPKVAIAQQFNPQLNPFTDSNNTTIFIGGLNVPISAEELRSYFATYGDIVYAKVLDGKNCGFVQYVNRPDAERAMVEMQGFLIGTSRLRLAWGQKYSQHQQQPSQQYQQPQQSQFAQQHAQQQQQQSQFPQQSLFTSLMNHSLNNSMNSNQNGYLDQTTFINGNYNFGNNNDYIPQNLLETDNSKLDQGNAYQNSDFFNLQDLSLNQLNSFH